MKIEEANKIRSLTYAQDASLALKVTNQNVKNQWSPNPLLNVHLSSPTEMIEDLTWYILCSIDEHLKYRNITETSLILDVTNVPEMHRLFEWNNIWHGVAHKILECGYDSFETEQTDIDEKTHNMRSFITISWSKPNNISLRHDFKQLFSGEVSWKRTFLYSWIKRNWSFKW